jgi:hypothetical protein
MMSSFYIVILVLGSITLTKQIGQLKASIKEDNKGKLKADIFFIALTIFVIAGLIILK